MRHRIELPADLNAPFSVKDAAAAGVSRWRSSTPDLDRPFTGIRAAEAPDTFRALVDCYRPRMREIDRFVGRTAMRLWGLPVPWRWQAGEALEIAVPHDANPPRVLGVRGRRLDAQRGNTWIVHGVRVVDPVGALFTTAAELAPDDAVIALDALLSTASNYPGFVPGRPALTREDVAGDVKAWRRFAGCGMLRDALELARPRVESPKESQTRLLLRKHGLSEPIVQYEVRDGGHFVARVDLAYPAWKIAIEYEGDGHRTDRAQWRRDIQRQRALEDCGWTVIRLTQADLDEGAVALIARIRRAIASRS